MPKPTAGLNIVLVSRSDPRLRECAAELERLYGVQTRTVAADLCKLGAAALDAIAAAVQGMEASGLQGCAS